MTGTSSLSRDGLTLDGLALDGLVRRGCVAAARAINRLTRVFGRVLAGAALATPLLFPPQVLAQTDDAVEAQTPIRILAFGDSLTAGYGLVAEDGFVPRLQAWLRANGAPRATVVNAGVSGDTTSGGLSRLDWSLTPDIGAVILELGANDMLRGVDPAIARDNLDQMLTALGERGLPVLLVGMRSLGNWGEEYVEAFEAIYPELAAKHGVLLYPFMLEGAAADPALNQPDGIHPNPAGVKVVVDRIGPHVLELIAQAETNVGG